MAFLLRCRVYVGTGVLDLAERNIETFITYEMVLDLAVGLTKLMKPLNLKPYIARELLPAGMRTI
jgi:hypothetical protein